MKTSARTALQAPDRSTGSPETVEGRREDITGPANGRRDALMLLASLGLSMNEAVAQDSTKTEPRSYKLLFENDKVRVIEHVSRPGIGVCGVGRHSHPDHVTVTLTPAKVKLTGEDGKTTVVDVPEGTAFWESASTHHAENVGGSGTRLLLIEIKQQPGAA